MKYLNLFSKKYKKVLAFDGGGVRAIMGVYFLKKLEEESSKSIFESFDLFIGTSAGATNALMLGMKGSSIKDLEKFWTIENLKRIMNQSLIDKTSIFQTRPKYSNEGKKEIPICDWVPARINNVMWWHPSLHERLSTRAKALVVIATTGA